MPKFSIVIPTYNRAKLLEETVVSALSQRGVDFEVVVSDNCSQDDTAGVVGGYLSDSRLKYFRNDENIGMVRNWRRAVFERATGEWFVLLSDDDYFIDPDYLMKVQELIDGNPSVVMVYAGGYLLDEDTGKRADLELPFKGVVEGLEVFVSRGSVRPQDFTLCNVVFNRRLAIELGAFSNPDNLSCDSELFLESCVLGDVGVINGPVSVYRFHSGNLLKTVAGSVALLRGNLDYLINPYVFAKDRAPAQQLRRYMENVRLDHAVASCLLRLALEGRFAYASYKDELVLKVPEIVLPLLTMRFKLRIFRYLLRGWFKRSLKPAIRM